MANALYPYYKQTCLDQSNVDAVDMNTDTLKAVAFDATAAYSAAHKYVGDIKTAHPGCEIGRSAALTTPTVVNGTFDCDDPTVPAVPNGKTIAAYAIVKDTGNDATSTLVAWVDHDSAGNPISLPGNGSDVQIVMDAAGLFDV